MQAIIKKHILNCLIWLLTAIFYFPVFRQLYGCRWQFIDYTHTYYILPISIWLAWRRRKTITGLPQKPYS
ncbi:MAG: hypothetical protein V2A64_04900 [Candidatus Omnitrophota bacterium]